MPERLGRLRWRAVFWLGLVLAGLFASAHLAIGSEFNISRTAGTAPRTAQVLAWLRDSSRNPDWVVRAGEVCGEAPFLMPTDGLVGFLWDDSFYPGHRHQGIDIFGGQQAGLTPIYAAHAGYLNRMADWKATLVIRIPDDPLQPGRQIWTYYTHMANTDGSVSYIELDFPPGTVEVYVEAGTLLGYQGDYSGNQLRPVGVHLHFSIVLDDGRGQLLNELEIENTLDPSPYLGLPLNANTHDGSAPVCQPSPGMEATPGNP
jgi:peptidoglycan LD-endopeptidase LytH